MRILIAAGGWRWIFLINLPVGLIALAWSRFFPSDPNVRDSGGRLDVRGQALAVEFFALVVVIVEAGERSSVAAWALIPMTCAVVALYWSDRRSAAPAIPVGSRRRSAWPAVARSSRADRGGRGFGSHRRCDLRRRIPVGADLRDAARRNGVADGDRPDDRSRRVRRTRRSGRRLRWLVQRIPTARWRLRSCRARRGTGLGGWCRRCGLGDARGHCDRGDCSRRDDVSSAPRGASSVRMRPTMAASTASIWVWPADSLH